MLYSPNLSDRRRRRAVRVLGVALTVACSLPAAADWLVTRDGDRIETDGPWKVKGRIVVYTDTRGKLSSLRLDGVDLEASEAAGEEPEAAPPAAEPVEPAKLAKLAKLAKPAEKKASVLVLTNKDIGPARETGPPAWFEAAPTLIMYSTDWCGVCDRARRLLADLGADYTEKDIEKSAEARREYVDKFGSDMGIPVFDYDGQTSTGLRPATLRKWVAEMKAREETVPDS